MNRSVKAVTLTAVVAVLGPGAIASPQGSWLVGHQGLQTVLSPVVAAAIGQDDLANARRLAGEGKFNEAIVILTRMIKDRSDSPLLFAERGTAYFGAKNYPAAEADFTKAIELKKTVPDNYFNRGVIRIQANNWAGASADFSEVIAIAPKPKPGGRNLLVESYANRAFCSLQLNKYVEAIQDCNKVLEVEPRRADILINRALANTKLSPPNVTSAITDYSQVISFAADPNQKRDAYENRADLYVSQGKFAEAVSDYTEGLKNDAQNASVYKARAAAYFQLSRFNEAIADYDKVLALSPNDAETYKNRAAVKSRVRDWQGTILDYSAYLQKVPNPQDSSVFRVRGAAYLNVNPKNFAGAINDFKNYLGKMPQDASAWKDLSAAQYNQAVPMGQPFDKAKAPLLNEAINSATRATSLDDKQADAYLILADSLSLLERYKEAISPYSKYIALKPAEPFGYEGRGRVEYNLQDYKAAVVDFDKYLKIKPGDTEVVRLLALARANAGGSATERIANLTEAIKADPRDPIAYTNRGVAYFEMNDFDRAIADFQKAVDLKPGDQTYLMNLASALEKKAESTGRDSDRSAAVAAYAKLNGPEALLPRANLELQLKQWDNAIADYTRAIPANQGKSDILAGIYNNIAYAALQKSPADVTTAIANYGKVIALNPNTPTPYKVRGLANHDLKNWSNAIQDLEKYLQLTGNKDEEILRVLADDYFNLGLSRRQQSGGGQAEFDKAIATYQAALTLKPGDPVVLYYKGLATFRKAQSQFTAKASKDGLATLKKSIADFEGATKTRSEREADAWYYVGLTSDTYGVNDELNREEMFKKAIAAYEKYLTFPGIPATDVTNVRKRIEELKGAL